MQQLSLEYLSRSVTGKGLRVSPTVSHKRLRGRRGRFVPENIDLSALEEELPRHTPEAVFYLRAERLAGRVGRVWPGRCLRCGGAIFDDGAGTIRCLNCARGIRCA